MNSIKPAHISITHIVELIALLLHGSEAMFGLKDLDHRYIYANRELESAFGVEPGSLIGRSIDDLSNAADAAAIRSKERAVMQSGMPERFLEGFCIGNRKIDCATIRFPFFDDHGQMVGIGFVALKHSGQQYGDDQLHMALENAQQTIHEMRELLEKMQLQARTDALTGTWNRRQIEENMRLELARLDRYEHPFSIVFMDLDRFKRINDTWGHVAGDRVLKEFCLIVTEAMRKPDMLGRWGGEEFILLLPHTDRVSARLVADRMRAAMEAHDFPEIGRVTASFGVATGRAKDTTEKLVERADTALYAAKQNGRNRVETDSEEIDRESEYDRVGFDFVRLVWRPAYECGHELIDLQHRMLFDDANQLLDAIIGNHPKEEVSRLIDRLLKDAVQHFDDEEAILKAAGYAEIETHARQHAELVTKALDLSVRNAADKLTLGELFSFLATELVARHLLSEDRKFFSCLEESAS